MALLRKHCATLGQNDLGVDETPDMAEREGLPRRSQKPNKIRHFLQARGRRVYRSRVPKSMGSLHPLRNIDHRFDRNSGECRYINLEGRFPLPPYLCSPALPFSSTDRLPSQ